MPTKSAHCILFKKKLNVLFKIAEGQKQSLRLCFCVKKLGFYKRLRTTGLQVELMIEPALARCLSPLFFRRYASMNCCVFMKSLGAKGFLQNSYISMDNITEYNNIATCRLCSCNLEFWLLGGEV